MPDWSKKLGLPAPKMRLARLPKPGQKPRKAPVQWEEQYHVQVVEFLRWAVPASVVWYHVPNGGLRSKAAAGKLKAMGVKPGVHDLVFLWGGVHHELELKAKGGGLTPEQKEHGAAVIAAGGKVGVASDTIDDVVRQLKLWGIPVKARL